MPSTVSIPAEEESTITEIRNGILEFSGIDPTCGLRFGITLQPDGGGPVLSPDMTIPCTYVQSGNTLTMTLGAGYGTRTGTLSRFNGRRTITFDLGGGFGVLVYEETPG